ncbi:MAG TPA: peroxiredoxin [Candidatus Aquilonibacter sp.]|nr:peroxiredoxin [Candidatus Aquilonibacter sp.]
MKTSRIAALATVACAVLALALIGVSRQTVRADDNPLPIPAVGTAAPDFTLESQEGPVSLHEYRGKWVVLYFYPKDQTPGCTIEAHGFQTDLEKYNKINAVVLGVSVDTVQSHKDWCAKDGLNFKLLSDAEKKVSAMYGSQMTIPQAPQLGTIAARNTFLIDPEGKIVKEFIKVNPTGHSAEVLAALSDLQKGAAN